VGEDEDEFEDAEDEFEDAEDDEISHVDSNH